MALIVPIHAQELIHRVSKQKRALGTQITISAYGNNSEQINKVIQAAFTLIDSLDLVYSDYNHASETFLLNQARKKQPIKLSEPLFDLLNQSLKIASQTEGRFDPSLGRLTSLWRKYKSKNRLPPSRKVKRLSKSTGFQNIRLHKKTRTAVFLKPKIQLDFGGIAKGYIGDQIKNLLNRHHLSSHLIDLGGDLIIGEAPLGRTGWLINIGGCDASLTIQNVAIAGSGATYQYIEKDGTKYSHILSPEERKGVTKENITVVFGSNGTWVDAMATSIQASTSDNWYNQELIQLSKGYFVQKEDSVFWEHFNLYIRDQLNSCL